MFDEEILKNMVNGFSGGGASKTFNFILEQIVNGKFPLEYILNFKNHPYFLIRKLAIEQIINSGAVDTLDYLYEFRNVSYHISQKRIIEYINNKCNANELKVDKTTIILESLCKAPKVTTESVEKNRASIMKLKQQSIM